MTPEELQELQSAIPALRLAIVSGTLRVTYDGRTIEYRSLAEMKAALRFAEDTVAGPAAASRRPTYASTTFSRG
jgi:hypothetical protein